MTKKELELAAKLLRLAAKEFSNHGCNDIDPDLFEDWTGSEVHGFIIDFNKWMDDDFDEDELITLGDDSAMNYLAHKLDELAKLIQ